MWWSLSSELHTVEFFLLINCDDQPYVKDFDAITPAHPY